MFISPKARFISISKHFARARGPCHVVLFLNLLLSGCSMLTPTALRCEYKNDPMGIDKTQPRFDWRLTTEMPQMRGQKQGAYQIMVATSEENLLPDFGDLWNSGVVRSDQTSQIVYEGRPLISEQHAYWKVRVWNADNMPSKWSVPAQFSMGLLKPEDWKAKWIGYDAPASDETAPQPG